jgi:SprT protein
MHYRLHYNLGMDENKLQTIAEESVRFAWARFQRIYKLTKPCPRVILNKRLKVTAGRCDLDLRVIDLCPSMFAENISEFERVIIPHEVAHQVAFDIFKDIGHGPDWKRVMVSIGLPADRFHRLSSTVMRKHRHNVAIRAEIRNMLK